MVFKFVGLSAPPRSAFPSNGKLNAPFALTQKITAVTGYDEVSQCASWTSYSSYLSFFVHVYLIFRLALASSGIQDVQQGT